MTLRTGRAPRTSSVRHVLKRPLHHKCFHSRNFSSETKAIRMSNNVDKKRDKVSVPGTVEHTWSFLSLGYSLAVPLLFFVFSACYASIH